MTKILDGNTAAAEAIRQIDPDVFGFYPITPTSYIGEKFSKFVADGRVNTEFVSTESEHAAMSVCVGAASAGGRAMTATASQGLLLMSEVLWNAAGMRLPIVLVNGNRALSAPLSIHGDHSDAMAVRDSGWIQIFAENAQEVYDFCLCAPRIAENPAVRTPVMVCMDCFQTTHTQINAETLPDATARAFVGEIEAKNSLLDVENPVSYGAFDRPGFYLEHKRAQLEGLRKSEEVAREVLGELAKITGRGSGNLLDEYRTDDAKIVVVATGSTACTLRRTVDFLREKGQKVGLVRPKIFRPFPSDDFRKSLSRFSRVLVLDRMFAGGARCGAWFAEISATLAGVKNAPEVKNAIFGLGGRETNFRDFARVVENFGKLSGEEAEWVGVRE